MSTATCRAVVIINSASGAADQSQMPDSIGEIFQGRGIECKVEVIAAGTNITSIARKAAQEGVEVVMAGGGDGTLRAVAHGLAGTQTAMAVVPVGTLNHFARDLEVPLDFAQAAEIAAAGVCVTVDVGEANGHVFINNAVIGLYPAYRSAKDSREARGWSRRAATLVGMLSTLWQYPILTVRFVVDGIEVVRRTPYVLIGNNEHAMQGSRPWERGSMTEGRLGLYILRDRSRLAFVRILLNVLFGRFRGTDQFEEISASSVTIKSHRRRIRVSLDGEIFCLQSPVRFRSLERALRVMVPATSKRAAESACSLERGTPSAP